MSFEISPPPSPPPPPLPPGPGSQTTARRGQPSGDALTPLALILVAAVILGGVMGLIWWRVAPQPQWVVTEDGVLPQDFTNSSWFGADGTFLLLGAVCGFLLALLAWRRCRRRPLVALGALVLGGALLAVTAWWLGGLLGPSDPAGNELAVGALVAEPLGLRALGVLFAPAIVAVATFVVLAAGLPPGEVDERL